MRDHREVTPQKQTIWHIKANTQLEIVPCFVHIQQHLPVLSWVMERVGIFHAGHVFKKTFDINANTTSVFFAIVSKCFLPNSIHEVPEVAVICSIIQDGIPSITHIYSWNMSTYTQCLYHTARICWFDYLHIRAENAFRYLIGCVTLSTFFLFCIA